MVIVMEIDFIPNEFIISKENINFTKRVIVFHATNTNINQYGLIDGFYNNNLNVLAFSFIQYFNKFGFEKTQKAFLDLVSFYNPDWIHMQLQFYDKVVSPNTIAKIKNDFSNIIITNWSADVRNVAMPYFVEISKYVDKSLIVSEGQLDLYKNAGCKNIDYWQIAIDPNCFYRKKEEERRDLRMKFKHNISFCANVVLWYDFPGTDVRLSVSQKLHDKYNDKFGLYGCGWEKTKFIGSHRGNVNFYSQNDIYNGSNIAISINHYNDLSKYFSDRQLVSMATGTLVVCHYVPDMEYYFENHKDLVWFKTEEECLDLIDFYLVNYELAEIIGKQGSQKILKDHTYEARVKELVKKMEVL
jgi:spore maturation protein CgeB